jgi:solute:Na+ symporter, SSS family
MSYLNSIDYTIIVVYFSILVGLGIYLQRKASSSMEDYFLAGRNLPWWALGISGMASWLDVTGTMVITSFLFLLGPRGLFIEFRGGAVLIAALCLLWLGKWHRRSQCITGAEWMKFRFGEGFGGKFARIASAVAAIFTTVGMLAYMIKGVGMFLSMFLPFTPIQCAMAMILVAAIYTMMSGFYGVVFTDVFQSGIIIIGVIFISSMAIIKIAGIDSLADYAQQITGNSQWITSAPHFDTEMPAGYEVYRNLFWFAFFYLLRNVFGGLGMGAEPKYFGAKNDRECGTLTAMTVSTIMFRWPLMISFAVLGLFLVADLFPDQSVIFQSSELIKSFYPNTGENTWNDVLSTVINKPNLCPPELIAGLTDILGTDYAQKLHLVSFSGTVNPERILPAVVLYMVPSGFRGMILIALIAASMSTFDTTVNMANGFFTRDIYQAYLRPRAKNFELMFVNWVFVISVVAIGFLMAVSVKSINDIWGWIIMGLGGGLMMPGILRLYWWRFNGAGFAVGTVFGLIGAILMRAATSGMLGPAIAQNTSLFLDERWQFVLMSIIGLVGAIIGTYLGKPTEQHILENFYRKTRPWGLWNGMINMFSKEEQKKMRREWTFDLAALPFALGWQITLFLLPMQAIVKAWYPLKITVVIHVICLIGMYFLWYKQLPETNFYPEEEPEKP